MEKWDERGCRLRMKAAVVSTCLCKNVLFKFSVVSFVINKLYSCTYGIYIFKRVFLKGHKVRSRLFNYGIRSRNTISRAHGQDEGTQWLGYSQQQ